MHHTVTVGRLGEVRKGVTPKVYTAVWRGSTISEAERHWMARWREGHGDAGMSAVSPSSEAGENLAFYKAFNITKHPKERTCPNHQARMGQAPSNLFPNRTCTHYTHHRVNTVYFGDFFSKHPGTPKKASSCGRCLAVAKAFGFRPRCRVEFRQFRFWGFKGSGFQGLGL